MRLGRHNLSFIGLCLAAAPPLFAGAAFVYAKTYYSDVIDDYKDIFGPIAGMVSAVAAILAALVVANFTTEAATRNSTVKAAWEALAEKQWDKDYIAARERYEVSFAQGLAPQDLVFIGSDADAESILASTAIKNILNDYEMMALGIKMHVLDEALVNASMRRTWITDYRYLLPTIQKIRKSDGGYDRYFRDFQYVSEKWMAEVAKEERDAKSLKKKKPWLHQYS